MAVVACVCEKNCAGGERWGKHVGLHLFIRLGVAEVGQRASVS